MRTTTSYRTGVPNIDRTLAEIARDINELRDSVNAPQQSVGYGATGKSGDLRLTFDDDGYAYLEGKGERGWLTTFTGVMVDKPARGRPEPYFKNLVVDNLYAKINTVNQTTSSNGNSIMSDYGIVESHTKTTITFKDQSNLNLCAFAVGDTCEVRQIKADKSTNIKQINFTVTAVSGKTVTVTYSGATLVSDGDLVVRVGNTTTASRQNSIYFSTSDTNSPYIDFYTGITGYTLSAPKVRLGKLDGVGSLTGMGLYAIDNIHLSKIATGVGIQLTTGTTTTVTSGFTVFDPAEGRMHLGDTTNYIRWNYDETAPFKDKLVVQGDIVLGNTNAIYSANKTSYADTDAGFWLGYDTSAYKINFGDATNYFKWTGTAIETLGATITGGTIQTKIDPGAGDRTRVVISGTTNDIKFYDYNGNLTGSIAGEYVTGTVKIDGATYVNNTFRALSCIATSNDYFFVNSVGQITKINNVTYAFPSAAPTLNQVLTCTNATGGVLGWTSPAGTGTVTSVAQTVPTGFTITGSPITTSGTLAIGFATGYSLPTDANQTNWSTAYTNRITSLTTTGSSGAATLVSNTLNIPNYTLAGLGGVSGSGTSLELAYWNGTTSLGTLTTTTYPSLSEISYVKGVTSAIQSQINAKAPSTAPTFATSITGSYLTASEILITDASKNIVSAPVITYPSLTELSYVKGASSSLQNQLNAKVIAPGANTADYVPLWNGTNSKTLKDGLPFTSAATASTVVSRNGSGNTAVNQLTANSVVIGAPLAASGVAVFYDGSSSYSTTLSANTPSSHKNIFLPNADGTMALGTGTANEIACWSATNTLGTLTTATYPSLTELSYVKGVTSSIQSQLNARVTSVSGTAPIASTGGTTPAISISQATTSTNGYLSSTDWNTFNNKQAAVTGLFTPAYGELYDAVATSTITTNGSTYVKWTGSTVGEYSGVTGSTANDNLTIDSGNGGKYKVSYSVSFMGDVADTYYWAVNVGGTVSTKTRNRVYVPDANTYSISGTAIISLSATNTIDLGCYSTNGRTVTVIYANLNIEKISN